MLPSAVDKIVKNDFINGFGTRWQHYICLPLLVILAYDEIDDKYVCKN